MSYQKSLQLIWLRYVTISFIHIILFVTSIWIKKQKQANKILEIANILHCCLHHLKMKHTPKIMYSLDVHKTIVCKGNRSSNFLIYVQERRCTTLSTVCISYNNYWSTVQYIIQCIVCLLAFVRLFKMWNLMLMSRVLFFCPLNLAVGLLEQTLSKILQKMWGFCANCTCLF